MSDTSFTNGVTLTDADWFNDVNRLHYTIFSDPTNVTTAFNNISPITTKGDLISNDGTNDVRLAIGTDGTLPIADSTETTGIGWNSPFNQNLLMNGDGRLNQRVAASGIADDTYDFDRWYTLTQTGTIAVSQLTDVVDGTPFLMRMTQSQAAAQRMGRAQIIESINCKQFRGQPFTLSIKHRISSAANLRFAVLEWTGTADAVTSDVVLDWTSSTYSINNFFINSTITGTVSGSTASTSSLAETNIFGTLGSTFNNLIVFIWTEGTAAQNVTLDLGVQLTPTLSKIVVQPLPLSQELSRCQRYYEKSYVQSEAPASNSVASALQIYSPVDSAGVSISFIGIFKVTKRATPTMTWYNPSTGTVNSIRNISAGTNINGTPISQGDNHASIATTAAGLGANTVGAVHWQAVAEL